MEQHLWIEIAWTELLSAETFITIPACVLHGFIESLWLDVFQLIKFLCEGA